MNTTEEQKTPGQVTAGMVMELRGYDLSTYSTAKTFAERLNTLLHAGKVEDEWEKADGVTAKRKKWSRSQCQFMLGGGSNPTRWVDLFTDGPFVPDGEYRRKAHPSTAAQARVEEAMFDKEQAINKQAEILADAQRWQEANELVGKELTAERAAHKETRRVLGQCVEAMNAGMTIKDSDDPIWDDGPELDRVLEQIKTALTTATEHLKQYKDKP